MSIAVVFPGQGSQSVGMGSDLLLVERTKKIFDDADEALGYKLTEIMFNGPDELLKMTQNTQPALLTHSIALWSLIKDKVTPTYFAGHSLGEYSALVAAGGIKFTDAVKAVHQRGLFMQNAIPAGVGGMAAVLGSKDEDIVECCKMASLDGNIVEPANYNCDGQVVVSGHIEALDRFTALIKEKGAKRVIPLPVSAAFHCSLMKPAQDKMEEYLKSIYISGLHTPVINNVDGAIQKDSTVIKDALVRQMSGAVLWTQSIRTLVGLGVTHFVEVGSGAVLTGLIKKIDKNVQCTNIGKYEDIEKL